MIKKVLVLVLLVAVCGAMVFSTVGCDSRKGGTSKEVVKFRCMNGCEGAKVYDKLGRCPKCNMPLFPYKEGAQQPGMPGMPGMPGTPGTK